MNEELIYLYRRKGHDAWATCDADRYAELSGNHFFEVRVARHQHDYAALEAECERLRQSMTGIVVRHFAQNLDRARRDYELEQYLSDGIAQLEAELDCLKSERDYLGRQLDRLIDQTTPLRPDATDPRWAERIKLDDVIAERDALAEALEATAHALVFRPSCQRGLVDPCKCKDCALARAGTAMHAFRTAHQQQEVEK